MRIDINDPPLEAKLLELSQRLRVSPSWIVSQVLSQVHDMELEMTVKIMLPAHPDDLPPPGRSDEIAKSRRIRTKKSNWRISF